VINCQDLMNRIQKSVGVPWQSQRGDGYSDGILAGDPDTSVTGIVTTFTPTFDVLRRAVDSGKNTIICREAPFYSRGERAPVGWRNGPAPAKDLLEKDAIHLAKKEFIEHNKVVIIRLTENWDARTTDGQLQGLARSFDWGHYHTATRNGTDEYDPRNVYFDMPNTTVGRLAEELKDKLKIHAIRVVGDRAAAVSKVALTHGLLLVPDAEQILRQPGVDVMIAGDTVEWEGGPYFQDLVTARMVKGLILLGQEASEEAGCGELATWLKLIVNEVPIEWIPAGEPFWTLSEASR
jgi:putative NIF3 family GTP cyclohydrolase 1 type 2